MKARTVVQGLVAAATAVVVTMLVAGTSLAGPAPSGSPSAWAPHKECPVGNCSPLPH